MEAFEECEATRPDREAVVDAAKAHVANMQVELFHRIGRPDTNVSGSSVENDHAVAQAGIEALG